MIEAAAALERGERHTRMLARLAQIGMELAEALAKRANETDGADAASAFAKIAQAVRRTIALEVHLSEGLGVKRAHLIAERASGHSAARAVHKEAKDDAIHDAVTDAISEAFEDDQPAYADELTADIGELLADADDFPDYLQRPVGETVAKLCVIFGLDPQWAVQQDEGWVVKRPPFSSALWYENGPRAPGVPVPVGPEPPGHAGGP